MASNFDEMIDRRNTASLKWDVEENELPMWVADMDFATAPCVLEAGFFSVTIGRLIPNCVTEEDLS